MRKGQPNGVLGDRGGKAKGPFEELAEVRGGNYLGHHCCIVFGSDGSRPELEKRSVDADTTSWNWSHNGGKLVFGLRPLKKGRLHNGAVLRACGSPMCRQWLGETLRSGSEPLQNLDAKMKEMIVVEVEGIGTMMPSPTIISFIFASRF